MDELQEIFGSICDAKTLQRLIEEVDINHDQQVDERYDKPIDLLRRISNNDGEI